MVQRESKYLSATVDWCGGISYSVSRVLKSKLSCYAKGAKTMYVVLETISPRGLAADEGFEFEVSKIACPGSTAPSSKFHVRVLDKTRSLLSASGGSMDRLWVEVEQPAPMKYAVVSHQSRIAK